MLSRNERKERLRVREKDKQKFLKSFQNTEQSFVYYLILGNKHIS